MTATFQRGEPRQVMVPVNLADAFSQGDLMGTVSATGIGYRASSETWNTDLATTQTAFALRFAGVAEQGKTAAENIYGNGEALKLKMRLAAGGVHRYACAAGTYKIGDYVGPAKQTGNALEDQTLALVASEALAIGKVVGGEGVNPGYIDVEILSRVFRVAPSIT